MVVKVANTAMRSRRKKEVVAAIFLRKASRVRDEKGEKDGQEGEITTRKSLTVRMKHAVVARCDGMLCLPRSESEVRLM